MNPQSQSLSTRQVFLVRHALCFFVAFTVLVSGGCSDDVVPAVARKVTSKPVFGRDPATVAAKSNNMDLGFLHEDHFACLSMNVSQVMSHDELADIPWDSIQEQLSELVGPTNSSLEAIKRIWVLVDRESVQSMMNGQSTSPFVFIVDYKSNPDLDELEKAQTEFASSRKTEDAGDDSEEDADFEQEEPMAVVAKTIGSNRIVIGSPSLTNKLKGDGASSELQRELAKLDFDADVEGVISCGPIRPTLESLLSVAKMFGGDEMQEIAKLPDVLQRIEFEMSLRADVVLETAVFIDDPEMVQEFTRIAQQAQEDGGEMPFGSPAGFPMGGMGGPNGAMEQETMFPMKAPGVMEKVGQQIQDDNLFSVEGAADKMVFQLKRPDALTELIAASIEDANRGFQLGQRAIQMQKIGKGLEAYYEKHNCFPPPGVVKDSKDGLPDQLNWRVGLLPFLDEEKLYEQFDFDGAWDSENNLEVAKNIPEMFEFEADESGKTCFHYPGGKLGLFKNLSKQKSVEDIKDRKIWTAVVVEGANSSAVEWTKPGVLEIGEDFEQLVGKPDGNGVLFLNGSFDVRMVKKKDPKNVEAILTPAGSENLSRRSFFEVPLQ